MSCMYPVEKSVDKHSFVLGGFKPGRRCTVIKERDAVALAKVYTICQQNFLKLTN